MSDKDTILEQGKSAGMSLVDIAKMWAAKWRDYYDYRDVLGTLLKQLVMGIEVEQEHTTDKELAEKIAKDHLMEDIYYYKHLKEMEDSFTKEKALSILSGLIKSSYLVNIPGHKNSKGESAPWVIKSHEDNHIVGSYSSEKEAKEALQRMRVFKHKGSRILTAGLGTDPIVDSVIEQQNYDAEDSLVYDKSVLIDAAAETILPGLDKLVGSELFLDRIWLDKIISNRVVDGHLQDGSVSFVCIFKSVVSRTQAVVSFSVVVRDGKVLPPQYFTDNLGRIFPFDHAALVNYVTMGIMPVI